MPAQAPSRADHRADHHADPNALHAPPSPRSLPVSIAALDPFATIEPGLRERLRALLKQHADQPGALLPLLHALQDEVGHVPPQCVPAIAKVLNLSRAEVHGVISYYHHFRSAPAGRHVVQVCRAESCQAMGADELLAHAQQKLGCGVHANSADGRYTLEEVFCLGLCASSPAIAIDERVQARMSPARFDAAIDALAAADGAAPAAAKGAA